MGETYFISDTHFNHKNIIKYCNRPFSSVEEMNDAIIDEINKIVKNSDTLYHLGDFAFGDVVYWRKKINCQNITIIRGNHDDYKIRYLLPTYEQILITINNQKIFLNHYPMMSWDKSHRDSWCLHGHVHGNSRDSEVKRNFYDSHLICDVGVDGVNGEWRGKPWSFEELKDFMGKKSYTSPKLTWK